jgi:hypothetical protein
LLAFEKLPPLPKGRLRSKGRAGKKHSLAVRREIATRSQREREREGEKWNRGTGERKGKPKRGKIKGRKEVFQQAACKQRLLVSTGCEK